MNCVIKPTIICFLRKLVLGKIGRGHQNYVYSPVSIRTLGLPRLLSTFCQTKGDVKNIAKIGDLSVEPVHSYDAFRTGLATTGVKGIIGMHRFNICLVVVLSLSCSGVKTPLLVSRDKCSTLNLFHTLLIGISPFFYTPIY